MHMNKARSIGSRWMILSKRRVGIGIFGILWVSATAWAAETLPTGLQVYDTPAPGLSTKQFRRFRDSNLKNAQEICIDRAQASAGSDAVIWFSRAAFTKTDDAAMSDGVRYDVTCRVSYFKSKIEWKASPLWALESLARMVLLKDAAGQRWLAITQRLPVAPYLTLTLRPADPRVSTGTLTTSATDFADYSLATSGAWTLPMNGGKSVLTIFPTGNWTLAEASATRVFTPEPKFMSLPASLKLGVATSAHQIEGGNNNSDWWDFEQKTGKIFDGQTSEDGPDHRNHIDDDRKILEQMRVQQYRMSVEWAKLEPADGKFDMTVAAAYKAEIEKLQASGIEPVVTLHHFTLPKWFAAKGGWAAVDAPQLFARFSQFVFEEVAPTVQTFVTINEPMLHILGGYVSGIIPPEFPGKNNLNAAKEPLVGLLRSHAAAYKALKGSAAALGKNISVGMAHRMDVFAPMKAGAMIDTKIAEAAHRIYNWSIPNALRTGVLEMKASVLGMTLANVSVNLPEVKDTQDYFGVNYYFRMGLSFSIAGGLVQAPLPGVEELTDMGWEMFPEGFFLILSDISKNAGPLPVIASEIGIGDARDRFRPHFIRDHLAYGLLAIEAGIPLQSFLIWSIFDNFEWDQGYSIRTGLYDVDYITKTRTPRPSALMFRDVARTRTLPLGGLD